MDHATLCLAQLPPPAPGQIESALIICGAFLGFIALVIQAIGGLWGLVDRLRGKGSPGYVTRQEFERKIEACASAADLQRETGGIKGQIDGVKKQVEVLSDKLDKFVDKSAEHRRIIYDRIQDVDDQVVGVSKDAILLKGILSGAGIITIPTQASPTHSRLSRDDE